MSDTDAMLELEEIEVRYGAVPAVRGLSLRVNRGEIVGLIGPNGAGKTTTLHAIMGVVPVSRGRISLVTRYAPRSPRRHRCSVATECPQKL